MDLDLAKKYGSLLARKREIEDDLRAVKNEISELEPLLYQEMIDSQMDRFSVACANASGESQKVTLYLQRTLVAKPREGNKAGVVEALKASDLGDLVSENYNANTLSAFVRETYANDGDLPDALKSAIETEEIVHVRGRSAKAVVSKSAAARANMEAKQ